MTDKRPTQRKAPESLPVYGATTHMSKTMRRCLATAWLEALGLQPTPRRVRSLAAHVYRFHPLSPLGQVANRIVLDGGIPSSEAVHERAAVEHDQGRIAASRLAVAAHAADPRLQHHVRLFIATYRRGHGYGPSWRELGGHLAMPKHRLRTLLMELQHYQVVTFSAEHGSLAITCYKELEPRGSTSATCSEPSPCPTPRVHL